ncbi:heme-binding protein [Amycolatopsis acidicola]|uniref:Heme-binding protein n=1 Tax=Amycolatopsis acidicola TaxID=2596893 RepID=A0A5N0UUP5_9PSEU|nr:heme-binding protein [Amycolatopsis acidicola]KAA9155294.1 heme-binding protein [Amycolatopsis acidicola]
MTTPLRQITTVTSAAARAIVDAAVAAAGQPSVVAVVDAAGQLSALTRMDGAPVQAIQIAQDKAYTAAGFGMPTAQWHEVLREDAPLGLGAGPAIDRFVAFGGGLPIVVDGQVVGAIGVSGGHWSDDVKIAEAGLAAL